ncbi:unnamed protein product [Ectocarpus sp. 8 AP-2014]
MERYYLSTEGSPYFTSPVEKTETVIAQCQEQTRGSPSDENFCVDLKRVGTSWRRSLQCALITRAGDRAPANEVLKALSRRIQGIVSTVSRTRGMAEFSQELARCPRASRHCPRAKRRFPRNSTRY